MFELPIAGRIENLPDALRGVMRLQSLCISEATEEMAERGVLIRKVMTRLLTKGFRDGSIKTPDSISDLRVKGSTGYRGRAEIPWVRIYSQSRSPSATRGWYVVYLFDAKGQHCYLSLIQGATKLINDRYVPRPIPELKAKVAWARDFIKREGRDVEGYLEKINLNATRSKLGDSYEVGNVYSVKYEIAQMPGEVVIKGDVSTFLEFLSMLYEGEEEVLMVPV